VVPAAQEQPAAPATPEPTNPAGDPAGTPQERLAAIVTDAGFTIQRFSEWCIAIGFHTVAITEWSEVTDQVANRILRSPTGLITQLKGVAK
jgi:uncharacterized membrane protein